MGRGNGPQQGGFPGVRQADDAHVGDQLQLQPDAALLPRDAHRALPAMGVADPAAAPFGHNELVAGPGQVGQELAHLGVEDQRAGRHGDDRVRPVGAALAFGRAVVAGAGCEVFAVREVEEGGHVGIGPQDHAAAVTAVAAVGPPVAHPEITVIALAPLAAGAGRAQEGRVVNKPRRPATARWWGHAGWTLTTRGFGNATTPSMRANRVSSRPRPTLGPGKNRVPRWRIKMVPANTVWPPYRLTPRYCGPESRPLRVDPIPFLDAMLERPPGVPVAALGRIRQPRKARGAWRPHSGTRATSNAARRREPCPARLAAAAPGRRPGFSS